MLSSVIYLVHCCKTDSLDDFLLMNEDETYSPYGFPRCKRREDSEQLFEIYKRLVSFPKFSVDCLYQNYNEETIGEYISVVFSKNKCRELKCFKWFQESSDIFGSLEEDNTDKDFESESEESEGSEGSETEITEDDNTLDSD